MPRGPHPKLEKDMHDYSAIIRITNLRLRTFIGFNPEERAKRQDVVVNVEIHHSANAAALKEDDIEGALDYKVISKAIIRHVEEGRFLLLEKLVSDLVEICSRDSAVIRAVVTVDKPHALRFADSVSLTLELDKKQTHSMREEHREYYPRTLSKAS
jgi:D-erythro-7,8-dihydroneopterin triphosphate epimerase